MARQRRDLKTKSIYDNFESVFLKWDDNLNEEVIKQSQEVATSIIMYIGLHGNDNDKHLLLNQKAKCVFDAISFLSRNDINEILITFNKLFEIKKWNRSRITFHLTSIQIKIDVSNLNDFYSVAIMSLNYLPSTIKHLNETTKQHVVDLFINLFDFMKVQYAYAIHATSAAYMLLKKHCMDVSMDQFEDLIRTAGRTFMAISSNTKAIEYCDRMTQILVSNWSVTRRVCEFRNLMYHYIWDTYDCRLAVYLLILRPTEPILNLLVILAPRLCSMLTEKNISSSIMKVIEAALPHLSLTIWNKTFVPILIRLMPDELDEQKAYVKSTLLECVNAVVKHFGNSIYNKTKTFDLNMIYTTLVLYCEVRQGLQNVHNLRSDIEIMLYSHDSIVQNYAFKMLCICTNKHFILNNWQFDLIVDYLEMTIFEVDTSCHNELQSLFSHICVTANDIIKSGKKVDISQNSVIMDYTLFIRRIRHFCLNNILSRSSRRVTFATQIFMLIQCLFKEDSQFLKAKYKLSKGDYFEQRKAPFFEYLVSNNQWHFDDAETQKIVLRAFYEDKKVYPEIPMIILNWYSRSVIYNSAAIELIYNVGIALLCSKYDHESIEKGCHCISIVLSNEILSKRYIDSLIVLINQKLLNKKFKFNSCDNLLETLTTSSLFGLTRCMLCLLKSASFSSIDIQNMVFDYCENVTTEVLNIICSNSETQQRSLQRKVIEYTLIACLDVMLLLLNNNNELNSSWFQRFLQVSNSIIENSNMKRPVTTAVSCIHRLCQKFLNSPDHHQEHLVIKFLEYILYSIYIAPDHLKSKIRRNPEHRLIIHAVITADQRNGHPFLFRTINFLNGILSDDSAASSSTVSSLHTIEILISDNLLRFIMQPFVVPMAVHCIDKFSNENWPIKNAAIQVLQSLVNRILGQKTNRIHRRNPINEVFTLFPQLALYFYSKLRDADNENIQDSIIAILAIFSESHNKLDVALNKNIKVIIESFVRIFIDLICTSINSIGKFAAKAFVALYPVAYIPFLICDIVKWIEVNFCYKSKNIFYTFMCVLELLYEKFNIYIYVPYYCVGLKMIRLSFQRLKLFLKQFNDLYEYSLFNLLNIKLNSIDCIEKCIEYQLQSNSYQARLWLNNHVPYVLDHIDIEKFPNILKICLHHNTTSIHLQNHCLNSILNRHQELFKQSLRSNVLDLIISKFLSLTNVCDYLVISYSHVILLLFEHTSYCFPDDILDKIRTLYNSVDISNVYIVATFISFLSHFSCYIDVDQTFVKNAVITYKNVTMTDDFEMHYHVSSTLKYLYRCVQISDRCEVFKMALVLLMDQEHEISSQVCRFIASVLNIELCNTHTTLHTLLSYKHLLHQLGTVENVCTFLVDVAILTASLDNIFVDCGQFYMKQTSDICLHKHYLKNIILTELKNVFKVLPRKSCMEILCKARCVLSY